jgi:importin subunit alpha-6/7
MGFHDYKNTGRTGLTERVSRAANTIELRNQRRLEVLNKRRTTSTSWGPDTYGISVMAEKVNSFSLEQVAEGATEFRRLLSAEKTPPIDSVVSAGLVPRFVHLLDPSNPLYQSPDADTRAVSKIMLESAWVLTNVASGDNRQTMAVVDAGVVEHLVRLVEVGDEALKDQCVWALGNIAGDCEATRDRVIQAGATDVLLTLTTCLATSGPSSLQLLKNLSWTISNLNRGRAPPPSDEHMYKCLGVVSTLTHSRDPDVVTDAYWALSYICDARSSSIDMVLRTDVVQRAIWYLHMLNRGAREDAQAGKIAGAALSPIIRMLGNIVTGNEEQTNYIIELDALSILKEIYHYPADSRKSARVRKEICWLVSNIMAGTPQQIDSVIDSGFLEILVSALRFGEQYIRTEACWAVYHATAHVMECPRHARALLRAECIQAFSEFVQSVGKDFKIITLVLEAISNLLHYGEQEGMGDDNPVVTEIEEQGLLDVIEELQDVSNGKVAEKAEFIIRKFFSGV